MPGEDRTGPLGAGPRTGRGLGRCTSEVPTGTETNDQVPEAAQDEGFVEGRRFGNARRPRFGRFSRFGRGPGGGRRGGGGWRERRRGW